MKEDSVAYTLVVKGMPALTPVNTPTWEEVRKNRRRGFYRSPHSRGYLGLPVSLSTAEVNEGSEAYKAIAEEVPRFGEDGLIPEACLDVVIKNLDDTHDRIREQGIAENLDSLTNVNSVRAVLDVARAYQTDVRVKRKD